MPVLMCTLTGKQCGALSNIMYLTSILQEADPLRGLEVVGVDPNSAMHEYAKEVMDSLML